MTFGMTLVLLVTRDYKLFSKFYTNLLESAIISTLKYSLIYRRVEYKIAMDISEKFVLPPPD
jgi:hypothetical protein